MDMQHPRVLQMVMDSLRYWVEETHVDGFRFDLGTILAREPNGFDQRSGFLIACSQDPCLSTVKLIAEPWDIGPGGYQVGGFPPGWAEWNDKFRDTVRDFWRGHASAGDMARRVHGSGDIYDHQGRRTWASVNFVAAHDGCTMNDLVTYNGKHNEANGEDNRDGSDDNRSWNCGVEGPTDDPEINALRLRQLRNFLASLVFSQGIPMLLAGDEYGRSQQGNNNAYCQDNELTWIGWDRDAREEEILAFARQVIRLRAEHPALRHGRFLGHRTGPDGQRDLVWLNAKGEEMIGEDWDDAEARSFGMLIDVAGDEEGAQRDVVLLVLNGSHEPVHFTLPASPHGAGWLRQLDTSLDDSEVQQDANVSGRSLVLFLPK
jgi:glycogen operon protein